MPKVSVIVPVYNVEKYLEECLDSVLNQTFRDYEVICVNDGSTDSSAEILNDYATKYPRIRIINQENQGLSMARNNGVDAAKGEYIYFLDSDDFIHPQLLELTYAKAKQHNVPLVCFDIFRDDGTKNFTLNGCPKFDVNTVNAVVTNNPIDYFKKGIDHRIYNSACLKLFHKDIFNHLKFVRGIYFEDMIFTSLLMKRRPMTAILSEKLYYYRTNTESITYQPFTNRHMDSYSIGLKTIQHEYNQPGYQRYLDLIKKNVFPDALEEMFRRINLCSQPQRESMMPVWHKLMHDLFDPQTPCTTLKNSASVLKDAGKPNQIGYWRNNRLPIIRNQHIRGGG